MRNQLHPIDLADASHDSAGIDLSHKDTRIMGRRSVAAVNLGVTLRTIAVESALQGGTRAHVDQPRTRVRTEIAGGTVPRMASQAQERRGLLQQIILDSTVRLVADRTTLGDRRVLIDERPLLIGVAFVADHVDRGFFQASCSLAVRIMTIRADHLSLFDGMV